MARLNRRMATRLAGIFPLLLSGHAWAATTARSEASLEIREAASLTVIKNPLLQLFLSSGSDTVFTLTASSSEGSQSGGSGSLIVNGSTPWAGMTSSGEMLSVSVAAAGGGQSGGAGGSSPEVRFVIAQFN